MGRTRTPKHRVIIEGHASCCWWTKVYGPPNERNLERYILAFNRSLLPSGANHHLTRIGVKPATSGRIEENCAGGNIVCEATVSTHTLADYQLVK